MLVRFSAGIEEGSRHDETPPLLAAAAGHAAIVQLLLEASTHPTPYYC